MSSNARSNHVRIVASTLAAWLAAGCVVSTHGGPGATPRVPLAPKPIDPHPQPMAQGEPTTDSPLAEEPSETIRAKHILVRFRGALHAPSTLTRPRGQARALAEEVMLRAKQGEDFGKLVQEYSEDIGSATRGGELGEFSRDMMVQEFSDAAFALEPGEVSDVVESPYGYHIILRTE